MNFASTGKEVTFSGADRIAATLPAPGRLVRVCRGAFAGVEGIVIEQLGTSRVLIAVRSVEAGIYLEVAKELLADQAE